MTESDAPCERSRRPLNVFITIDTECSSLDYFNKHVTPAALVDRDIYGITPHGEFGIRFQLGRLERWGLRAIFQVESLCVSALGFDCLKEIVDTIQRGGQEVQMHLHTEWTQPAGAKRRLAGTPDYLKSYSEDQQAALVAEGLENLDKCGARKISGFRAGNFGANLSTLRVLRRNGIPYDTSYNMPFADPTWLEVNAHPLLQPRLVEGVHEIPISFFYDWRHHPRHVQLGACSIREMRQALLRAWADGWSSLVILSHSFELIRRGHQQSTMLPSRIVVRRFEELCRFLATNRDKFRTRWMSELKPEEIAGCLPRQPLRSKPYLTLARMAEQLIGRVY